MASDDVQLTDLAVIQQFSLAVRSASAPRDVVVAALEADLAFLTQGARRRASATPAAEDEPATVAPDAASSARVRRAPTGRPAVKASPQVAVAKATTGRAPRA